MMLVEGTLARHRSLTEANFKVYDSHWRENYGSDDLVVITCLLTGLCAMRHEAIWR